MCEVCLKGDTRLLFFMGTEAVESKQHKHCRLITAIMVPIISDWSSWFCHTSQHIQKKSECFVLSLVCNYVQDTCSSGLRYFVSERCREMIVFFLLPCDGEAET